MIRKILLFMLFLCIYAKDEKFWKNWADKVAKDNSVHFNGFSPHCGVNNYQDYEYAYDDDSNLYFGKQSLKIGKRIVGGQISRRGEWPWLSLLYLKKLNGSWEQMCGGSLIHPYWVITAAHCFESKWMADLTDNPRRWRVKTGEHNVLKNDSLEKSHMVEKIHIHPLRDPETSMDRDIALVKLKEPVRINSETNVICLPSKKDIFMSGKKCFTSGVGQLRESNPKKSKFVRHVKLPLVSHNYCQKQYEKMRKIMFNLTITEEMICAGYAEGGMDACQYDSGGPMICYHDKQWLQVGIVSLGFGCARSGYPGIYTRVASFIEWIKWEVDQYTY